MSMRETLERANEVKPIMEKNGKKYVSYEDATILQQEQIINQRFGEEVDLGDREINPDGTVAKSKTTVVAMNEDRRLLNRYRVVKKGNAKVLQVVMDYRAITEQTRGICYTSAVSAYELERTEDGELKLTGTKQIEASEFISKFVDTLNKDAMYEVLGAVSDNAESISADEMPI